MSSVRSGAFNSFAQWAEQCNIDTSPLWERLQLVFNEAKEKRHACAWEYLMDDAELCDAERIALDINAGWPGCTAQIVRFNTDQEPIAKLIVKLK